MRVVRVRQRFNRAVRQLGAVSGTAAGAALAKMIRSMMDARLPGPGDREALMPPVARYWVRRVPGQNLWLWFAFSDAELHLVALTRDPPVPIA